MAITAAMVKELREKSGAGMMDAKKALTENNIEIPFPQRDVHLIQESSA